MATQGFYYSNTAVAGFLGASITNAGTSVYLTATPSGYPAQFPFRLVLGGSEVVHVTAGAGTPGTPWTVLRGQDGTTAQGWTGGGTVTAVQHQAAAGDYTLSRLHESYDSTTGTQPHGLPLAAWQTASLGIISETTLNNSTTSAITWSSIPQTYKHLVIYCQARLTEVTLQSDDVTCQLNGDAGAHYSYLTISAANISGSGTGTLTQSAATASAVTSWPLFRVAASLAGANVNAGGGVAWLPNYTGAAFNKMFAAISGAGNGSTAMVDGRLRWGFWNPVAQAAVTQVSLSAPSAFFLTGSFFGLYGWG